MILWIFYGVACRWHSITFLCHGLVCTFGVFSYILYSTELLICMLQVREEYIRWLTCSCGKDRSVVSHIVSCFTEKFQTNLHVPFYIADFTMPYSVFWMWNYKQSPWQQRGVNNADFKHLVCTNTVYQISTTLILIMIIYSNRKMHLQCLRIWTSLRNRQMKKKRMTTNPDEANRKKREERQNRDVIICIKLLFMFLCFIYDLNGSVSVSFGSSNNIHCSRRMF